MGVSIACILDNTCCYQPFNFASGWVWSDNLFKFAVPLLLVCFSICSYVHLLDFLVYPYKNNLSTFFNHFSVGFLIFFMLMYSRSLYVLYINSLLLLNIANIFSQSIICQSNLSMTFLHFLWQIMGTFGKMSFSSISSKMEKREDFQLSWLQNHLFAKLWDTD